MSYKFGLNWFYSFCMMHGQTNPVTVFIRLTKYQRNKYMQRSTQIFFIKEKKIGLRNNL